MGAAPSSDSSSTVDGRAVLVSASGSTPDTANQAQSKRAPAPHMFREIVADAEEKLTDAAALEAQVSTGVLLAGKTKKYWVDERTRHNCFMLLPRGLHITWSEDPRYWSWHPLKEGSDGETAETEAVALQNVCWLEVHGKLELSHLTPGVTYDVFFEAMLNDPAYGWSTPVNLRLKLPDGTVQQHKENLLAKPRGQWLQLKVGEIEPVKGQNGEAEVSMFEYDGGQWKRGLLIKGIKIVPKRSPCLTMMKYWVDERTRHNCFMLLPRGLHITWSEDPKYWSWHPLKGSDGEAETEAVALQNVCWLEVHGKLELSRLTPGVTYEVFFEAMLNDPAYGWSTPVNLRLKLPDGTVQQHKENLLAKPRGQWLQLKVGEIEPQKGQNGEAEVSMFEYDGGQWKRGLLIKGIKIVPRE